MHVHEDIVEKYFMHTFVSIKLIKYWLFMYPYRIMENYDYRFAIKAKNKNTYLF